MSRVAASLACLTSLACAAGIARADYSSRRVTNNARGTMVETYHSGPGTNWSRTTDITQRTAKGSIHTIYETGSGTKWSKTTVITTQTPNGSVSQTYRTGSDK